MNRALTRKIVAFGCGTALWLGCLRLGVDAVRPTPDELADQLTVGLAAGWEDGPDRTERAVNPEWDFMSRTYVVLALANEALADPERAQAVVPIVDRIIDSTLEAENEGGVHHFLLPYSRRGAFRDSRGRSLFVDGELALMMAARQMIAADDRYLARLRERVGFIEAAMEAGPALSGESYPNECWTFCNTTALAALAVADAATGDDHSDLGRRWVERAKADLVDEETGLLVSSYDWDGNHLDGPEGSSLWMVSHNLLLIDPEFAEDQFRRSKASLSRDFVGFGWSAEWPRGHGKFADVDSGPVVPLLDASPGSSGLAILGASAFGDEDMRDDLLRSLEFAAFPVHDGAQTHYAAAGTIGSAVVAYALRFGPLWREVSAAKEARA